MPFIPQQHLEPIRTETSAGSLREWVEIHTYDDDKHVYITVHGDNMDSIGMTVELFLNEAEVRSIRAALDKILGEDQ